jgi:NTP pyrophosphatase (non-canonical NTP hydrolase)
MLEDRVNRALNQFMDDRDWKQFHSFENLAKSISIEAAELLEVFQWGNSDDEDRIKEELADVLTYCFLLAEKLGCKPTELILEKLTVTEEKYPVEKAKGTSTKYDRF